MTNHPNRSKRIRFELQRAVSMNARTGVMTYEIHSHHKTADAAHAEGRRAAKREGVKTISTDYSVVDLNTGERRYVEMV